MKGPCREFRQDLVAYLDGELGGEAAQALARHLEACADCRREALALERTARALQALQVPALPPGLEERVLARVRREGGPVWPVLRVRWAGRLVAAAAAVLLAGLAVLLVARPAHRGPAPRAGAAAGQGAGLAAAPAAAEQAPALAARPEEGALAGLELEPEAEQELLLALDVLEKWEVVEALELLETLEELEDPSWLLLGGESG